ncbi:Bug family tripartite tricarboxylate transporter substrate binding protein [Variovorax sp. N23]|uniref:Bug family tripartite tricarboxylate transporter substrate binding protein n=1 Tax=Variovorax sp. N23 TaxID=2980555 RepID=UPI0021C98322|nr:tripartite tricarboxylate transporter substrate-binding protein [Variovorax sp. N23]MCU4120002.1 tripartite tricarboxylate transporter substrate-binding protein [Variovorax sp. N23]
MRLSTFLQTAFVLICSTVHIASVQAQTPVPNWPTHSVHITVANTPGSAPDVLARYLGPRLSDVWKQPVVIDNRAGAGGIVAAEALAKAPADGYSMLVGADGPITILPQLLPGLPYDARADLVPVVSLGKIDFVLVANPRTGFKTLRDFTSAAKLKPGQYNYASAGNGSPQQFGMELLKQRAGIHVTHIPYRGGPLGMQDVIAGQVDVMFIAIGPALPHIRSGRLVALAVGGEARHPLLPDVPTVADSYAGFKSGTWFGLFAPARTPQAVVDAIGAAVTPIVRSPAVRADLAAQGIESTGDTQRAFSLQVAAEYERYAQIVKVSGIKAD